MQAVCWTILYVPELLLFSSFQVVYLITYTDFLNFFLIFMFKLVIFAV